MKSKRNNKMITALKTLAAVLLPILTFSIGILVSQVTAEQPSMASTDTDYSLGVKLVETHTVQYIEQPVTEVKYIERMKNVPVELRNFSDLDELKQWLADKSNVTTVLFQSPDTTVDCDDYALELQYKALAEGYIMSFQVIGESAYNAIFATPLPPSQSLHAVNLAIIDNSIYYIEPQTNEIGFAAYLD